MPNSSVTRQPINQAMVHQVLHMLRAGQLRKCKAMGLGDDIIKGFDSDKYLSILANSSVPWCELKVNTEVVRRLFKQADRSEEQARLIDRAIHLGASSILITSLFGLSNQEIKHRRDVLGVPQRKGRWPMLSEQVERDLWSRWALLAKQNSVDTTDLMAILDVAILIAEEYANRPMEDGSVISLSQIWSNITAWIDTDPE